jgi:hypothetical protein
VFVCKSIYSTHVGRNLNLRRCKAAAFVQRTHGAEPIIAKGISCRLGPLLSAGLRFAPGESAINKGIKAESAFLLFLFVYVCECLCLCWPVEIERKCAQGARRRQGDRMNKDRRPAVDRAYVHLSAT